MNRHTAADKDEANCGMHHSLREQMGQLVDRERVLCSENDQLRAQLVEMKEQEKKKYDDLMVEYYNMKREYEDDGLDNQGTSNNQVTVKTEWDDQEVKVQIKEEIKEEEDDAEDNDIIIKQEFGPAYIKTESNDVKMEIKEEIKEEEDNDEDSGWDRCLVKKELNNVDMVQIKEEVEDGEETRIIDMETLTEDRQVKQEIEQEENEMTLHNDQIGHWVKREIKEEEEDGEMVDIKEEVKEEDEEDGDSQVDDIEGLTQDNPVGGDESRSVENASMNTTLTQPTGQSQLTVTQSADLLSPSTSTAQDETSPTALDQQTTAPTGRNDNKRRQQTSNKTAKRSKIILQKEDGEDGEEIANEDREEAKVKVVHLNCTESNCNVKLNSMDHFHNHLSTVHQLAPLQCFVTNCTARFDEAMQIHHHSKLHHPQDARFLCAVCHKEYDSQHNAYVHWYQNHLTGQFKCNLVSDCVQVSDTRKKVLSHQQTKHHSQSKHFHCTQPGCTASFSSKGHLKQHESIHLNRKPFHCSWLQCSHRTNRRAHLVTHIRMCHFGLPMSMKAQKEKNIVDLRDPNEYVRVVVEDVD